MDPATLFENRIFKFMVLASLGIHGGIFLWTYLRDASAAISFQEVSIQADLEMESPVASIASRERAEEIKVDKQILPQLPKQYEVQDKPEQDEKQNEELALKEEEHKEEEKKPEIDPEQVKRERILALQKKQALERLLKDKARKEEKFSNSTKSPLNQLLLARKKQLEQGISGAAMGEESFAQYGKLLKKWMQNYYSMPEVYSLQGVGQQAVVELVLDTKGGVRSLTLLTSSQNEAFDQLALATVRKAAPFPAPPRELVGKKIHYHFDSTKH
jgi:protein TonB